MAKTYEKYEGKEDHLQTMTANYLRLKYPSVLAFHTPNGGLRNKIVAAKLKRQGVRPGVPDWLIIKQSGVYCGLAIELKVKGGAINANQKARHLEFIAEGWDVAVVWSLDEFIDILEDYLT
tara:strand:+ start:262 stop:624 length:363 start_codon:yes stop_codon:yes gene_type:complete